MRKQKGCGKCKLCGSLGTSITTCPLNPKAKNPNPSKHNLAKKSNIKHVLPKDSKLLQLKGPGSMPKLGNKSTMLSKRIRPRLANTNIKYVLPKDSKLLQLKGPGSMPKQTNKSRMLTKRIRPRVAQTYRGITNEINREYEVGLQIDLERHREQDRIRERLETQKQQKQDASDMRREKARSQRRAQLLSVYEPVEEVDELNEEVNEVDIDEMRRRRMSRFSKQIGTGRRHRYRL